MDREMLFCMVAGVLGLADEGALREVAVRVRNGQAVDARQELIARAALDQTAVASIDASVEEHLKACGGDARAAAEELAGPGSTGGTLSLEGWWAQQCASTQASPDPGAPPEEVVDAAGDVKAITPECRGRYVFVGGSRNTAELARGGLGRVLVALDRHLGRNVAMKELLSGGDLGSVSAGPGTGSVAPAAVRFLREARVTGQLEHPNIVPVYELGVRDDGTLYYTMRLVHGRTMARALKECLDLRDRLKLLSHFADVCHAVAFAHSRGVIHRDLKAENVMLGEFGETVVLDWGLAKVPGQSDLGKRDLTRGGELLEAAAAGLTVEGSVLGTPDHMSPEQARGALEEIDERSDVWALGTVLYEILTGQRAFAAPTPIDVLRKVLHEPVVPPRQLAPSVPSELESVCLKALAKDKAQRYPSAGELAREIESYQSGEKVVAHEYSAWEHLRRFAAKKRAVIVAAAVVAVVTVGALVGVTRALAREKVARGREAEQRLLASYHLSEAFHEKAAQLGRGNAFLSARVYAAASLLHNPACSGSPESRAEFALVHPDAARLAVEASSWAWASEVRAVVTHQRTIVAGQAVCGVAISRDGALVAGAACDGGAWVWEASSGTTLLTLPSNASGTAAVAFSPDGQTLACATEAGEVRLWQVADGKAGLTLRGHTAAVADVAFSRDGSLLASAGRDGVVMLWDARSGGRLRTLAVPGSVVHSVAFATAADLLVTGSRDASVRLWEPRTGRLLRTLVGHAGVVRGVALSPDGSKAASASYDRTARVWDTRDGSLAFTASDFDDEVLSVAFSVDGGLLAVGGWDSSVGLYDAATGKLLHRLQGHTAAVWDVAFDATGGLLVSASDDGSVRLWALGRPSHTLASAGQTYLWASAFSPDGRAVATGSADRSARIWDASSGALAHTLSGHRDTVGDVAFSPDGKLLATASFDGTARLWDAASGELVRVLAGHSNFVRSLAFSPDGSLLATGSYDQSVILWAPATGRRVATLAGHEARVRRVAFSPDGRVLATGGDEPVVHLWDPRTASETGSVTGDGAAITGFAFSHSGKQLAVVDARGSARIWDLAASRWGERLHWDEQTLNAVVFSPDDTLLLVAGDGRRVIAWSVADCRPELVLETAQSVVAIAVAPDGRSILVGDGETARFYPLERGGVTGAPVEELRRACQASGLTLDGFNLVAPR